MPKRVYMSFDSISNKWIECYSIDDIKFEIDELKDKLQQRILEVYFKELADDKLKDFTPNMINNVIDSVFDEVKK